MSVIANLVSKAVQFPRGSNGSLFFTVEKNFLSQFKTLLRDGSNVNNIAEEIFRYLSIELKKKNGVVRMRVLYIIDYLFTRSCVFRNTVSNNIKTIANAADLMKLGNSVATCHVEEIRTKTMEMMEIWDHFYSHSYPSLHVMVRYLRETLKLKMPNTMVF